MDEFFHRNWSSIRDEANIAWLVLDKTNMSVNTLNAEVLEELHSLLQALQKDPVPLGLVIQSGKRSGFIAGADVQQFKDLETSDAAFNFIRQGQIVFNYLADLPFPTVALIRGFCLGGGLELALACRYRVAIDHYKTKIGLPEVQLGLHPGWGGTVRLPRLIGGLKAMDLILTGKTLSAGEAYKRGVVDAAVPERQGLIAARHFIQKQPQPRVAAFVEKLTNSNFSRSVLSKILQKKMALKVNKVHYPAPYIALEHWREQGVESDSAFMNEAKSLSQLAVSETARNLVRVFHLQEKLKRLEPEVTFKPEHVHVIGAGVMGGDIAAWCALKNLRVTLQDQNEQAIAKALNRAVLLFKKHLKQPYQVKAAMDRLMPDVKGMGIKKADLIIEAIVEKVEAKNALFAMLEQEAKRNAIFATNTSTIPLSELTQSIKTQMRLIGLHFFNPVARMPLVEVIAGEDTEETIVQKGMAFVRAIEKLPLPVKSSPGFLVNRILLPYLLESMLLLEAGIPDEAIDKAAVEFGMPMGPIELADTVGLDVCLYAAKSLSHYFGGALPVGLSKRVEQGQLGKKTGQGFYQYKNGKLVKKKLSDSYRLPEDILDRLTMSMLNAAVACLREQVVSDVDYLDAGMIFGAGFPPFRGGPMHYIAEQGESLLLQRLNLLAQRYGQRFVPDVGWTTLKIS